MNRTVKAAAILFAAAGILCQPALAVADASGPDHTIVIGDGNQVAGDDIFNAGCNNIVGSGNGDSGDGSKAAPSGRTIVIGDRNQVAGDDIFNAGCDNIVGSGNGGSGVS